MNNAEKQGCLGLLAELFGAAPHSASQIEQSAEELLPYHVRDDFLSPVELNFYRVLQTAAGDWAVICPKVSLGDLFYAQTGDYATNAAYRNKIDRKHMDFLLLPASLPPTADRPDTGQAKHALANLHREMDELSDKQ
jgi:hypothetical protein